MEAPFISHPDYAAYPDHPLHGVDPQVLAAARAAMQEVVQWKDVAPEMADPIADAIVMAVREYLR